MHGLWLLVLLKLVTPSLVPVPVLPEGASSDKAATVPQTDSVAGVDVMRKNRWRMTEIFDNERNRYVRPSNASNARFRRREQLVADGAKRTPD